MSKLSELAVSVFGAVIETEGKNQFVKLVDAVYAKSADEAEAMVKSMYIGAVRFVEHAGETKTKLDDIFADGLKEALEEAAAKYGFEI